MPNTPHSSWNLSSRQVTLKAPPPRLFEALDRGVDHRRRTAANSQPLAPRGPDPAPGDGRLRYQPLELEHPRRIDGHDHPRRSFAEEREIGPRPLGQRHAT